MKFNIVFHKQKMEISVKTGFIVHLYDELLYIVYDAPYCWLVLKGKKYMVETSLQYIMDNLPKNDFFQCNRSVIVNINYCKEYRREESVIVMDDYEEIRLSRRRVKSFHMMRNNQFQISKLGNNN